MLLRGQADPRQRRMTREERQAREPTLLIRLQEGDKLLRIARDHHRMAVQHEVLP